MNVSGTRKEIWKAKVIRADGRVEDLGVVDGGTKLQGIVAFFRIKFVNCKHMVRQLLK